MHQQHGHFQAQGLPKTLIWQQPSHDEYHKKVAAEYLRCDRHTISEMHPAAREVLEPDIKKRYDGLVNIGIDETSYRDITMSPP